MHWVKRKLDKAWSMRDASRSEKGLKALANELQKDYPGAAASLLEGLRYNPNSETSRVIRFINDEKTDPISL